MMRRILTMLAAVAALLTAPVPTSWADTCPPAGFTWDSTGQGAATNLTIGGTTYTVISGTGNNSGSDVWVNSATDAWGDCETQPVTSPDYVKGYPHIALNAPNGGLGNALSTYSRIRPSFSADTPGGTYEWATDAWLNGHPGDPGVIEVMMWPYNNGNFPAGSWDGTTTASVGGHTWRVYIKGGTTPTYTFLISPGDDYASGAVPVLGGLNWLAGHGYYSAALPVDEVDFGAEVTDTAGVQQNFEVDGYSVSAHSFQQPPQ